MRGARVANFETMLGLLELVYSAGGELDSRIRIQKEAYLLASLQIGRFRTDSFSYHHYGPYSRDLSDALQSAVSLGLLSEVRTDGEDGSYVKYEYTISDDGKEFVKEANSNLEPLVRRASEWKKVHWRALELAATVKFLEISEGMGDREKATKEALRLKPSTTKYLDQAKDVLSGLN
jgi:uncharacterized protein